MNKPLSNRFEPERCCWCFASLPSNPIKHSHERPEEWQEHDYHLSWGTVHCKFCLRPQDTPTPQPPASEGEGWKEIDSFLEKLNIHHRGMVCFNDALAVEHLRFLIQAAIDEAVEAKENEWQELFDNEFQKLKDALPTSAIRDYLSNPHSPQ